MPKVAFKLLIIDYDPRGIKQLSDPLESAGYEIRVAKDGVAGIEKFHEEKPDLVLVEAMLPKRHGFEVCQEIKQTKHGRDTPVVVVTSVYKGRKYRSQAIHQHGADEYLEKPIAAEKLMETVERLLEGRAPQTVVAAAAAAEPPAPGVQAPTPPAPPAATTAASPSAPPASTVPPADSAEAEIVERLNQILGDPAGGD